MNSARRKLGVLPVVAIIVAVLPGTAFGGHEAANGGGHGGAPPRGGLGGHATATGHVGGVHVGRFREAGRHTGPVYVAGRYGARMYLGSTALWTPCDSAATSVAADTVDRLTGTCGPHWGNGYWVWSESESGWVQRPGRWWVSPDYPGWVWMGEPGVWDGKGWASRDGYWTMVDASQARPARVSSGARRETEED
jgi:hypothetical protein